MPRNIRLCDVGVKILKFFLVTSTAIVLSLIWFGLITKTWNFGANPFRWIAIGIILFFMLGCEFFVRYRLIICGRGKEAKV